MKIVSKEDVLNLYKELLPWEQEDVKAIMGYDMKDMSQEEVIKEFGINPLEFVDEDDVVDCFGTTLLKEYSDYDILDELDDRLYRIDGSYIIDALYNKREFSRDPKKAFDKEEIERLEKFVKMLKGETDDANEEVLGTTAVIRDDDGDIQDGTYESWLTLYDTEFNLPSDTKFKEGDKVEIFARKTN
jgi:hypothetical protein